MKAGTTAAYATEVLLGTAAPPQANGEPVFATPAQARLFGMAHALVHAGVFDWDTFRDALIAAIAEHESARPGAYDYYACFAAALETLLAREGVVSAGELAARAGEYALRPTGHDHAHPRST